MIIIATLICSLAFTACNTDAKLAMDKRYISESDVRKDAEKQVYYIFHSDGTGEYTYHYDGTYTHSHYILHFKYTYVDGDKSAVACFYDSIESLANDEGYKPVGWSELVTVSKNVLATVGTSGYVFWINEDYLEELTNFRK